MTSRKQKITGQFFTTDTSWIKPQILEFIKLSNCKTIIDPYAGQGDILNYFSETEYKKIGYDIDTNLNYIINDSLVDIPKEPNSIIITNPPYLTSAIAKKNNFPDLILKYFENSQYDDLYKIAIQKCMESSEFGVMIVPETYINNIINIKRLNSITIIEKKLFSDTRMPVCVICYDNINKETNNIKIYKDEMFIGSYFDIFKYAKKPKKNLHIKFNSTSGKIALRAIDSYKGELISFVLPENANYDFSKLNPKTRFITLIEIDNKNIPIEDIISKSNEILNEFRINTHDLLLSAFQENNHLGIRRRRINYEIARAILEEAVQFLCF